MSSNLHDTYCRCWNFLLQSSPDGLSALRCLYCLVQREHETFPLEMRFMTWKRYFFLEQFICCSISGRLQIPKRPRPIFKYDDSVVLYKINESCWLTRFIPHRRCLLNLHHCIQNASRHISAQLEQVLLWYYNHNIKLIQYQFILRWANSLWVVKNNEAVNTLE